MKLHEIAMSLSGMSFDNVFGGPNPPVAYAVDASGNVTIARWDSTRLNGVAEPTPAQLAQLLAAPLTPALLLDYANEKQWEIATGGYTFTSPSGQVVTFDTSVDSLTLIAGKDARLAKPNPPTTVNWQLANGSWVALSATDFDTAAVLIDDFVQATFDVLRVTVEPAIMTAGTITTTDGVDAAAWPANHN